MARLPGFAVCLLAIGMVAAADITGSPVIGTWTAPGTNSANNRQYDFRPDGSYEFRRLQDPAEAAVGGSPAPERGNF